MLVLQAGLSVRLSFSSPVLLPSGWGEERILNPFGSWK